MRYRELINAIAIASRTETNRVEQVLDAYTATIIAALQRGDIVAHKNLAVYYVGRRTARTGVNPRTLDPVYIPAARKLRARFAKSAHNFLN